MNASEFKLNLAVVIGINDYRNGVPTLGTARQDAEAIAEILETKYDYQVHLITDTTDTQATSKNLKNWLETELPEVLKKVNPSRLLFYFAGHGIALNGDDGPQGYLIPQDAKLGDVSTYLPMQQVEAALTKLSCRHCLVILDCCFAGAFRWSSTRKLVSITETIHKERYDRFIQDPAWQVITSAASDQYANDSLDINGDRGIAKHNTKHSPFAAALMEALSGKADAYPVSTNGKPSGDGVITATELYLYLRDAVEPATEEHSQRQTPGIWPLKNHDKGEYIFLAPGHPLNLPPAPPLDESKNPYRGLESFCEEHSDFFFGRTTAIEKLYEFVSSHTLTIVLGASGSGKSSLVKAGLIPFLKQQLEANSDQKWQILAPFRPGESPLKALNNTLAQEKLAGASITQLGIEEKVASLSSHLADWSQQHPNKKMVLAIDQFEELITLCKDEQERDQFLALLAEVVAQYPKQLRLVLTLRSDFEPQFRDTALKEYWNASRFVVSPMTRADLREAIEKPAEKRVMYFEPHELVEQLIDEVADMPGALPLLSFGLSELYLKYLKRQRDAQNGGATIDRSLTQADYQDLGGAIQSLTQRADEEYETLVKEDPAYAQVIRQVMLRMVAIGGGELARRQVPLSELEYPQEKNGLVKEVIERFTNARLLVKGEDTEGNSYVEPAHDALVRGWQKLLAWKQEEEESLLLQRRLTPSAVEWESIKSKEQPSGFQAKSELVVDWLDRKLYLVEKSLVHLWQRKQNQQERSREKPVQFLWDANPYLNVLREELKSDDNWFNRVEAEFVDQSVLQKRRNISWRWRIAGAVTLTIFTAAVIAFIQWINAQKQLVSTIGALTNSSQELFESNKEFDALLASLNAGKQVKQVAIGVNPDTQLQVKVALQQAIYQVKERNRLDGLKAVVYNVSYSPDGQLLASASGDKTIKLWNVATGKEISLLTGHKDVVTIISFSPDGKLLASGSFDGTVKLWDVATRKEISSFPEYGGKNDDSKGVSFSPDGRLLAFADNNNKIKIWDVATHQHKTPLIGHSKGVTFFSFSPDGKLLASASWDQSVKLWDVATGEEIPTNMKHKQGVIGISFSPDGQLLASGSDDGNVKLWDIANRKEKEIANLYFTGRVKNLRFSPNGQLLVASGFNNDIKFWNVLTHQEMFKLTGHRAEVTDVNFSPDGKYLASASRDQSIKFWYVAQRQEIKTFSGHGDKVVGVSFSPDGRLLASPSRDNTVKLLDVDTGQENYTFSGHSNGVTSVSFSPDGKRLASASYDKSVKLWDVDTGQEIHPEIKMSHNNWVTSVSFSPDGKLLASASWDKSVKLWDVDTGHKIPTNITHEHLVKSVSFSPDGKLLASASGDKTIKLWDVARGKEITHLTGDNEFNSVSFSPDGRLLASADDTSIKLWDVAAGKEIDTLTGHKLKVNSVSFSPNGKRLASASDDHSVILWDVATRKEINIFNARTEVNSIRFSPDGRLLASGNGSGTVMLWNLEELSKNFTIDNLLADGCNWVRNYLENKPESGSDKHLCDDVNPSQLPEQTQKIGIGETMPVLAPVNPIKLSDGRTYIGELGNGKPSGKGILIYLNGTSCAADFSDGQLNGTGSCHIANGDSYEGEFQNDEYNGQGKAIYADKSRYEGGFQNGKWHGEGVYTDAKGKSSKGKWNDGKLIP